MNCPVAVNPCRWRLVLALLMASLAGSLLTTRSLDAQSLLNERRQHAWSNRVQTELLRSCLALPEKRRAAIAELLADIVCQAGVLEGDK